MGWRPQCGENETAKAFVIELKKRLIMALSPSCTGTDRTLAKGLGGCLGPAVQRDSRGRRLRLPRHRGGKPPILHRRIH